MKTARPKKSSRRYVLKISEAQAKLISVAVELYARLGTGQFMRLDRFFLKDFEQARPHLDALHILRNGSLQSFGSIASKSIDDDYRVLYDLHQVIRHRLAWDRDPSGKESIKVDYDTPYRTSKKESLAMIEPMLASEKDN